MMTTIRWSVRLKAHSKTGGVMDKMTAEQSSPLEIISKDTVYQEQGGAQFTVDRLSVRDEYGNDFALHVVSVEQAACGAVCVVEHAGKLLLGRHWRVSTGEWGWEFPRGMGKMGETPVRVACRELAEETGLSVAQDQISVLQHMHADTGLIQDDIAVAHVLVTSDVEPEVGRGGDWELRSLMWFERDRIEQMIRGGEISDGITLAAYDIWRLCASE